jgi:hypothetical protein
MKRLSLLTVLVASFVSVVSTQSCGDPEQIVMKIMSDQGLTLLRPARDYVRVGGIVVMPKKGNPDYVDPLDSVPTENGNVVDIKTIIAGQTRNGATGLGVAVAALGKLVALPLGLTYTAGRQVTLSQMDLAGNRLISKGVNTLATAPETSKLAKAEIANGSRVFIVQEVHTGTRLSLSNTSNLSLGISLGTAGPVPTCTPAPAKTDDQSGKNGATNPSTGRNPQAGTTPSPSDSGAKSQSGAGKATPQASGDKPSAPASNAATKPGSGAPADQSAQSKAPTDNNSGGDKSNSVGLCHNTDATLTVTSMSPIGFAVRLTELQVVSGIVSVKYGSFKFPSSLGTSDAERGTATLTGSALQSLQRRRSSR